MPIKTKLISMIERAEVLKASDIHFILKENAMHIQFRVGSLMIPHTTMNIPSYEQLLAYIKFQASLTLTHPRQPQSGLLTLETDKTCYYARISILPTSHYQSLVMRLINHNHQKTIDDIPYFIQNAEILKDMAKMQAGLILISGPTGSGKTTTTYAFIDYLKHHLGKSIVTIEDPVEYQQPDIVQMQVNESLGMTYDVGIKEVLRHDPDVIVIGEIRDSQTAQQALRAAFTGHLVISTVHSKNIIGTISRLLDLGLSYQELEQALVGIINQRLIQKDDDKKALLEICFGEQLDHLFSHLQKGKLATLPYKTLDEELFECQHHVS